MMRLNLSACLLLGLLAFLGHADEDGLSGPTVRIRGVVTDAFRDELYTSVFYYVVNSTGTVVTVATQVAQNPNDVGWKLVGSEIAVIGTPSPTAPASQSLIGETIHASPGDITVVKTASVGVFNAPELERGRSYRPLLHSPPERRRAKGVVLAVWRNWNALIKTPEKELITLKGVFWPLPKCGDSIEASGIPEADFLQSSLTHCFWRPCATLPNADDDVAIRTTIHGLLTNDDVGNTKFNYRYHGRTVTLRGRINGIPTFRQNVIRYMLTDGMTSIPVYIHSDRFDVIEADSTIEITGICVAEMDPWTPGNSFPGIRELLVFAKSPDDVRVIKGPPWWTTQTLVASIIGLSLLVCGAIAWSLLLKRVLARKSKALEKEIAARFESDLKTRERTRLAVELHDTIAQTLSGMSMEIGAAVRVAPEGVDRMLPHLNIAARTLQSCRDDLRDCLWDLRSNALEADSMDKAILTTLRPILGDLQPVVRFNVLRKRLSDNTAHALLRIIHELVSNALRHGHAKTIRIAGHIDDRRLLFSVRDDGDGFDVGNHPGPEDGHFGLEGIKERIRRFNGTMEIDSSPGSGTRVALALDVRLPEEEDLIET